MGTPATITFTSENGIGESAFSLYRHYDGDPITQLDALASALEKAEAAFVEAREEHPGLSFGFDSQGRGAGIAGGFFIGETTDAFGMAARPVSDLGNYWGEYNYAVDLDSRTITLTDGNEDALDPYSYIERLHDEYQDSHRTALDEAVGRLEALGFTIA